jgi:hypothetical protein
MDVTNPPMTGGYSCPCGLTHDVASGSVILYQGLADNPQSSEFVIATVPGIGSWRVPAIYLMAHSLSAEELPTLADRHGFALIAQRNIPGTPENGG